MTRPVGECFLRKREGLPDIGAAGKTLHAAASAAVHWLDHEVRPVLGDQGLKLGFACDACEPWHRYAALPKALLHRELVAGKLCAFDGNAGKVQTLGDESSGYRRVRRNAQHPVNWAMLGCVALRRAGRFLGSVNIGDEGVMGVGKTGRIGIHIGNHDMQSHGTGALDCIDRFDSAGNDEQRLGHWK